MLTLITEVRRGAGWDRTKGTQLRGLRWRCHKSTECKFMNVVRENETKWTYLCLIKDPAQVKRSGVQGVGRTWEQAQNLLGNHC